MCAAICSWRVLTNRIVEPLSAARTAMLVWPHRPNRYSTPRPSRYLTSWCETSCFMAEPWWSDAADASGFARVAGERAPRDAGVAVRDVGRHRPLDAAALLRLLPGVGEDADRAREEEDAAPERGREAELGIDHRGRAVDVHRDRGALRALEQPLDRARVAREAPADDARRCRLVDQLQQPDRARIDAVPAVAEAGNDLATLRDPALER